MHSGKPIKVISFDSEENPLQSLESAQSKYLKAYLVGAGVRAVAIEHNYFDRDYLDEFSAFYGKSARGYDNICQRLHFFSDDFTSRLLGRPFLGEKRVLVGCKRPIWVLWFVVLLTWHLLAELFCRGMSIRMSIVNELPRH